MNIRFHYELQEGHGLARATFIISSVPERESLTGVSPQNEKKKNCCALDGSESSVTSLTQGELVGGTKQ